MKIKLKVSLSGTNFSYHAGQETELDAEIAKQWIEAGVADEIKRDKAQKSAPVNSKED